MDDALPSLIVDPRERKRYFTHMTLVRWLITHATYGLFRLFTRMEFEGAENLPGSGPVVVAANHMTNFDVFPIQFALPRLIFFMGKAELFQNPVMDYLMRQLGGFPVNRGVQDEWARYYARRLLENGLLLGIFPEGKRNKGAGLQEAKTGAARLAIHAGCPIVPVAVQGTQKLFGSFPFRANVTIRVGKPILPQPGETPADLTNRLMYTLAEMLPEDERGVYAHMPACF